MSYFDSIPDRKLSLFEHAKDFRNAGYVYRVDGDNPAGIWDAYASGYLSAVEELIKSVLEGRLTRDTYGYPIFYLFSHYLELKFKEIIQIGRPVLGEKNGFPGTHNLLNLWGECKRILKEVYEWKEYSDLDKEEREIFLTVDRYVKEFSQDEKAQTFRYPVDVNGKPLMKDSIVVLNIENLDIVTNWLSQVLDGLCTDLYQKKSRVDEYHAEQRAEYHEDYWG